FELGGHSLLVMRLVSRIRAALGAELPVRAVFEAPTLAAQAEAMGRVAWTVAPALVPVSREGELVASFGQHRFWVLAQLSERDVYDMSQVVRLRGALDEAALVRAVDALVARHEVLRTTLAEVDDVVVQRIEPARASLLRITQASSYEAAVQYCTELKQRAYDLTSGPLFAPELVRIAADDHVLVLRIHHAVSDEWSMEIIWREIAALYRGETLPALAVQYADFAMWQRSWVAGEVHDRQLAYWQTRLAGAEPLELPTDRPRPAVQGTRGAMVTRVVPPAVGHAIEALGRTHATTPFMTYLAAFYVLLHRYSHQTDLSVGTPVANRGRPETDALVGYLLNTVVLRANVDGNPRFTELLAQVRDLALGASAHQDVPFERVVETLRLPRDPARSPLFQAMFVYLPSGEGVSFPGLEASHVEVAHDVSSFDVTLFVGHGANGLGCSVEYSTDLFDAATIEQLLRHYQQLLEAIVAEPAQRIGALSMLDAREREQMLVAWNATARDYPRTTCLHQLVEAQVDQRPDKVAIVLEGALVTFAELERRANQLAQHLIDLGAGPEVRVGVFLERSIEMIVAILGILKAGAAYVPLETQAPTDRLAFIVEDARAPLVVTQDRIAGQLASVHARLVRIDGDAAAIAQASAMRPSTDVRVDNLAYVIYTSGTTGRQKGVQIEHRQIVNLVTASAACEGITEDDRILQFSSIAFDSSVEELFTPLTHGATMVLRGEDVPTALELFGPRFAGVTVMNMATAYWHAIAMAIKDQELRPPAALRMINIGGERALPEYLRLWHELAPDCVLNNQYGPTETTVMATAWRLDRAQLLEGREAPIGQPLPNYTVYVLDARGELVPVGVDGELYIGGESVARGYLDRPELTTEKFVANPFGAGRLYRTGDVVRWRPDGNLEFVGRVDDQVKIRGFRIELGEVETAFAEHAAVTGVTVVARQIAGGEKQLVAYVVLAAEATSSELGAYIRSRLPAYMVPARLIVLDALPISATGKVNKAALPDVAGEPLTEPRTYEPPVGEIEERLARIWRELLGLDEIGRNDNFFELGGHSLLAMRMLAQLRGRGWTVDVRTLFATPTLGALAASMRGHQELRVPANAIVPGSTTITPAQLPLIQLTQPDIDRIAAVVSGGLANVQDIYGLTPLQEGMLFHHQLAPAQDPYVVEMRFAFSSRGLLDRYLAATQQVIDRHDILRTVFVWDGLKKPAQVVLRSARLQVTELAGLDEFVSGGFDLTQAPLMRCVIAPEPGTERWVLVEVSHHLIGDHESLELMRSEVAQCMDGRGAELPAPYPFRNAVAAATLGMSAEAHQSYFHTLLGDIDEPSTPFGMVQAQLDGTGIVEASQELAPELVARLRAVARQLGVSVASVCHVAWGHVVARTSGRTQAVFGTVLFGRVQVNADSALGLCMNTLPMRLDLDEIGVADATRRAHAVLAELMEHEHAPLALAQRCSGVAPPAPLFTSLLNYRHSVVEDTAASSLAGSEWLGGDERTNYPLFVSVDDDGTRLGLSVKVAASVSGARVCAMFARGLEQLAIALEQTPSTPIREVDILPEDERRQLLETMNATARLFDGPQTIHELVALQAMRTPDAIAVEDEVGGRVTYRELAARVERVAGWLEARGVAHGDHIVVSVARTVDMVAAVLAVMRVGAAYVPIDPEFPEQRRAYMRTDAGAVVELSDVALREALVATDATSAVAVDGEAAAYVLYTSGSTGLPKGVRVPQRAVVNFLHSMRRVPGIRSDDVLVAVTTLSFDIAGLELYLPLIVGAKVVLASRETAHDSTRLARLLEASDATIMQATPATWRMLVGDEWRPPSRLRILCGGEALPSDLAATLVASAESVWNLYGPTETTIWSTCTQVTSGDAVPIGAPIDNTTVYVLDGARQLAPLGVPGELYIGGRGVALGYHARPELTAERFVDDPFAGAAGARMYRTGDRVRWRADGKLEYLGRVDTQVKVRGYRIELGEIEATLRKSGLVSDAAVIVREDVPGNAQLVAYVVAKAFDVATCKAALATTLPDYMVPTVFVVLDALPLTPNQKVDRKALPAPDASQSQRAYVAPRTEVEVLLAQVWRELLGLERVGIDDSFFELGGHSLLAMRLVSRVRAALGTELPVRAVFESPTLAAQAEAIGRVAGTVVPALVPVSREGELVASFGQQRFWVMAQLAEGAAYDMTQVVRLRGALDEVALARAVDVLVARHEVLRTTLAEVDEVVVQRIAPARMGVMRIVEVGSYEAARAHCEALLAQPFELSTGPLFAPELVRIADDDHVVVLRMHHVIGDEWSMMLMWQELGALYQGRALPPLAVQYADFAAWQRSWVVGDVLAQQLNYWRARLEGGSPLEVPTDRPRPAVLGVDGIFVERTLPLSLGSAVEGVGRAHGATPFMTYIAAFYALLHRYSQQDDISIGTPVASRGRAETDALIGYFLNTVVLRANLGGSPSFEALLDQVRDVALGAYAHQDAPFDRVIEALRVPRNTGRSPLFQAMFVYQRGGDDAAAWGSSLEEERVALDEGVTAKFELTLTVLEHADRVTCVLEANAALFDATTLARMLGHYERLLGALVAEPGRAIDAVGLLSDSEQAELAQWNATARDYAQDVCLHELFEAQVDRT
ncbi:MAG: amino acid adenylation domain-containing protein, partial [Kofleriaceae bacterium]|nr:amino acid adenylation domain-containing protein [Kofleriaceae bacterium]